MKLWDKKFSEKGYFYGTEPNVFIKEWGKKLPRDSYEGEHHYGRSHVIQAVVQKPE